ncbi:MAG: energy-coupling factor transporter transmembrane protein EcfT [Butyrivibrio sp.]|nr:energy-coupling factor transporter transmembrane protein EcfT [Butyrivibrio sp.]
MNKLIAYEAKNTPIHRLSGFTKLVFFLLWCITSAMTFDTRVLGIMVLAGAVILIISRTEWRQVSKVFGAVLFFMTLNLLCIFLFAPYQGCEIYGQRTELFHIAGNYTMTREQLFYELNVMLKYFTVVPTIMIFLVTTDPSELAASVNRVGVPYSIAYSLAIALRYIPDVQEDFHRIRNAQQARGIEMAGGHASLLNRIQRTASIIFPLLFSTMERIDVISNAMELRGFGKHRRRTWYAARPLSAADIAVLICAVLFTAAAFAVTFMDGSRFYYPW